MKKLKQILRWDTNNNRFGKLFLKNWLLVFVCIVGPLLLGTLVMQEFSNSSLLREMDASVERSATNTTSTVSTLFNEVCTILRTETTDENILAFLASKSGNTQTYEDVVTVRAVQKIVSSYYRESLYFSVDVYAFATERIVSSYYQGQHYTLMYDDSLVECYDAYIQSRPTATLFAVGRTAMDTARNPVDVITVYKKISADGFLAISVDTSKLISHVSTYDYFGQDQGAYLLADENNRVIMDTSVRMNGDVLDYLLEEEEFPITGMVEGIPMRIGVNDLGLFGWKCVQMVPVGELEVSSMRLRMLLIEILIFGGISAFVISYWVTRKLFRPVRAILHLLENPSNQMLDVEEREEYRYLLVQILELFQKNITLEEQMSERVFALRSARAKTLQGQMTPHFLNNVLQSINWIAIEETGLEQSRTSEAIMLLAETIRMGKERKTNFTTVESEIDYTKQYVKLEQLRHGNGIRCHYDIQEEVLQTGIPCMTIQPLVENAIIHGIPEDEGDIYITIKKNENDGLDIQVEDNGTGIEPEAVERIFELMKQEYIYLGEHLGIINLFQRFRLLYGEECSFYIGKSQWGGTCVQIRTPEASAKQQIPQKV